MADASHIDSAKPRMADLVAHTGRLPRCPNCNYDLADTTRFQCPECGAGFTLNDFVAPERPVVWLWSLWYTICGLLTLAGLAMVWGAITTSDAFAFTILLGAMIPLSVGGLPIAAMITPRFVLPDWREPGRYFFAKFFILLWPLMSPGLWLLGGLLFWSITGID